MFTPTIKAVCGFALLLLCSLFTFAQAPQGINYQAVVRNAQGAPITSGTVALRLTIHQGSATGTAVFTEVHHPQPNQFGLVDVVIGSVANLGTVNWGNGSKFLQVELDAANGTNFTNMGTTQLMSVPYALHAGNAAPAPGTNVGDLMEWNGTAWVNTNKCNLYNYYYRDADGDGKGDKFHPIMGCAPLPGFVADSTDCNDNLAGATANTVWYRDFDNDTYGSFKDSIRSCTQPVGYVANNNDCNDSSIISHLGTIFYRDADNDLKGSRFDSIRACTQPTGYVSNNTDCNDSDASAGASNGFMIYRDADADGYGDPNTGILVCPGHGLSGYSTNNSDCNDNNSLISPDATELCDGIDNDCDGVTDNGFNFDTDVNNCSGCGIVCSLPNATSSCNLGQCFVLSCNAGFADVNGNPADGCEVNLAANCIFGGQAFPIGANQAGAPCIVCSTSPNGAQWTPVASGTQCSSNGQCDGAGSCVIP